MPKKKQKDKLHVKPTQEELDEEIKKSQKEAEALKEKEEETPVIPSEPAPEPSEPPETPVEEEAPEETEVGEEEPEETELPEEEPVEPDYKEKFIQSSKEAQILHAKNKKTNEQLDEAIKGSEPTEDELKARFSDWEVMSDFEKQMATESLRSEKVRTALSEIVKESKGIEDWVKKLNDFVGDPQSLIDHPDLEGRQEEFKLFATKPTRRNVDFVDLVSAFLYDATQQAKPKMKKQMFEKGTGGPPGKPKAPGKISVEEAARLRNTDYKKYKELLIAGKIATEEI